MSDLPGVIALAENNTVSVVELQPESLAVLLYALAKIRNPQSWRDYYGEYMSDEDIELIHELVDLASDNVMRPIVIPEQIFPMSFMAFGHQAKMVGTGALQSIFSNIAQFAEYTRVVTPYINNEYEFEVLLAKGEWNFNYMAFTNNSSGQVRLRVDGVDTAFLNEYYSAVQVVNVISNHSDPVTISTDGIHKISFKMVSKHASSSNYNFWLQALWGHWVSE